MLVERSLILITQGLAEAMKVPQSETGLTGSTLGPLFRMPKRRLCFAGLTRRPIYDLRYILAMRRSTSASVGDCLSVLVLFGPHIPPGGY